MLRKAEVGFHSSAETSLREIGECVFSHLFSTPCFQPRLAVDISNRPSLLYRFLPCQLLSKPFAVVDGRRVRC